MKRPSVEASLKPLKAFQRCTVEHAFHRLFTADDSTGRFLVADEVGLGKTLVARGIIARAIRSPLERRQTDRHRLHLQQRQHRARQSPQAAGGRGRATVVRVGDPAHDAGHGAGASRRRIRAR